MFYQLKKYIHAPRLDSTDRDRVATLLNVILILLFTGSLTYIPVVLILVPERISRLPLVILIAILAAGLKALLHRGRIYLASGILVTGLWSILTVAILSGGGVHDSGYNAYIVVIVIAALLLGGRATLIFATLSILVGAVTLFAESVGLVIPARATSFTTLALWFLQSIYIGVAAGLLYLAARSINSALQQARSSAESARKSEQEYRLLMEEASDAIFIADGQGKYLDVNARACELLGYTRDELLQLSIQQIITPENLDAEPIRFAELEAHMTLVVERSLQHKDGHVIPTEVSARMLEDGRLLAIVRDITQRKQAEQKIRESEERYRLLAEHATDMISRHSLDGVYLYVSPASRRLLGYEPNELVGRDAYDFYHPGDVADINQSHQTVINEQTVYTVSYRIRHKSGDYVWVETTSQMIHPGETGGEQEIIAITRDISKRKQTEIMLRQERDFSDAAIDSLPGMFYVFNKEGEFLRWNRRFEQTSGYNANEIRTMHPLNFIHEADQSAVAEKIEETFQMGEAVIEARFLMKQGNTRPYYFTGTRIEIEGQEHLVGVGIDITDRKQAEKALAEQAEILQTIFDHIPVMIAFFDKQGRFKLVNRQWEQVLGWTLEEVRGRNDLMAEFYPNPEYRQSVIATMRAAEPGWSDFQTQVRDGRILETSWANVKLSNGMSIGIGSDITRRKQAEKALKESEQRYRALAESSSVGIWHIDTDGYTIYANPAMCAILEIGDTSFLEGRTYHEFFTEDSLSVMRQEHAKRTQGVASAYEVEMIGQEGSRYDILISGAPLFTDDGKLDSLIGTFVDITERKQAEAQRLEAERLHLELENERKITQLKTRFMSIVAHEFRTPLAVINLNCDMLNRYQGRLPDGKREQLFQKIRTQIKHLERVLDDFSLAVRAQSGHLEYQPTKLDLHDLIQKIIRELQDTSGKNHQFIFDDRTSTGIAMGDERLLAYVIRNLLSNAIKYSPDGGEIRCSLLEEGNAFIIRVSDQGIGIPPDDQEHLFEAYYRAANVDKISGTGLGLKIVKDCVDLHNGQITVESKLNQGTTFSVLLLIVNQ